MFCTECHSENADHATTCAICGAVLQPDMDLQQPAASPAPLPANAPGMMPPPPPPPYGVQIDTFKQVEYAGFWLRAVATFIDGIMLDAVILPLLFVSGYSSLMTSPPDNSNIAHELVLDVAIFVIGTLYFALMESSPAQATLGKMLLGLKVTDLEGNRLTFGRAFRRNFAKLISQFTFLIGYIMAGLTSKKQALHDLLVGTLVVRK